MVCLIIGGSGSGKSEYAENRLLAISEQSNKSKYYIATMQAFGKEAEERIKRHQRLRAGKGFTTIECKSEIGNLQLPPDSFVLLECLSNLVANEMFEENRSGNEVVNLVLIGIQKLMTTVKHLVIVTNNVFEDGISYDTTTLEYIRVLGELNIKICEFATEVVEVYHGIPLILKGSES